MKRSTTLTALALLGLATISFPTGVGATGTELPLSGCESLRGAMTVPGWLRWMTVELDDGQTRTWTNPDAPNYDDPTQELSIEFPTVAVGTHTYYVTDSNGPLVTVHGPLTVEVPACPVPATAPPVTTATTVPPTTAAPATTAPPTTGPAPTVSAAATTPPPVDTSALALPPVGGPTTTAGVLGASVVPTLPATGSDAARGLAPIGAGFLLLGLLAGWASRREGRSPSPAARRALGA